MKSKSWMFGLCFALAAVVCCGCGGRQDNPLAPEATMAAYAQTEEPGITAAAKPTSGKATIVARVFLYGAQLSFPDSIQFSRSISGRKSNFEFGGSLQYGEVRFEVPAPGYFVARLLQNALSVQTGEHHWVEPESGRWGSIPVNPGKEYCIDFTVGGPHVITSIHPLAGNTVTIADEHLRQLIAGVLNKTNSEPMTAEEIASIRELDIDAVNTRGASSVTDLSGLAYLKNLEKLRMFGVPAKDISPVAGLTKLWDLNFAYCGITDLSPLANLRSLRLLAAAHNGDGELHNISALSNLTELESLYLGGEIDEGLSPLANLTKLQSLHILYGQVRDIRPLAGLSGLVTLDLTANKVSDISVLARFPKLVRLHLGLNPVQDFSALSQLTVLEYLDLQSTGMSDVSVLSPLSNLQAVLLYENPLADLSTLLTLSQLREVYVSDAFLSTKAQEQVSALQEKGVRVTVYSQR